MSWVLAPISAGKVLGAAMIYGGRQVIQQGLVCILLCYSGRMPWNYVRFLDDAAERALLYKVGGGYIFIHHLLQDYFADFDALVGD